MKILCHRFDVLFLPFFYLYLSSEVYISRWFHIEINTRSSSFSQISYRISMYIDIGSIISKAYLGFFLSFFFIYKSPETLSPIYRSNIFAEMVKIKILYFLHFLEIRCLHVQFYSIFDCETALNLKR